MSKDSTKQVEHKFILVAAIFLIPVLPTVSKQTAMFPGHFKHTV